MKDVIIQKIEELAIGEIHYFNMFQEGGAIAKRTEIGYDLFEIPLYSGCEIFEGSYGLSEVSELVEEALSWT